MEPIIIAIVSSGALSALVSGIFTVCAQRKAQHQGLQEGLRQLLYLRIKDDAYEYINRGYITRDEFEDTMRSWKIYHEELKGNGYLDDLMKRVKQLPIR